MSTTLTLADRLDAMLAGIREDGARRKMLQDPSRANPMVARALGGDAATIAELRAVTGELAREVVSLKQERSELWLENSALAKQAADLRAELQHYIDEGLIVADGTAPEGGA